MENIFNPYPNFSKAVIKENDALELLSKYDNILLETINGKDIHKCDTYCVYIKNESDLHWLINLFSGDRTRKMSVIRGFYNGDADLNPFFKDEEFLSDQEFYGLSLYKSETTVNRYTNHSVNGILTPFNADAVKKYGLELKPDVLDSVYLITNGTPQYSMGGTTILLYQCSLINMNNIEPRKLVNINLKEKYIV